MSRIGKKHIDIPEQVTVSIDGQKVAVKGPHGEMSRVLDQEIAAQQENNQIIISKRNNGKVANQKWGMSRTLVNNMVLGVTEKFKKTLHIKGVGYKAIMQNKFLNLNLGYSHDIKFFIPEGVEVKCPKATVIELYSHDKEVLGQVAAEIRSLRLPEPYKGKGVKYEDEFIFRKEGKK